VDVRLHAADGAGGIVKALLGVGQFAADAGLLAFQQIERHRSGAREVLRVVVWQRLSRTYWTSSIYISNPEPMPDAAEEPLLLSLSIRNLLQKIDVVLLVQ